MVDFMCRCPYKWFCHGCAPFSRWSQLTGQFGLCGYFREYDRDLTYGAGGHKCLGMHLATMGACIILQELLDSISDYEVIEDQCVRAYGEHLSGFLNVPIRVVR